MSDKLINAALAARLQALGLPTAYENAPFTPTSGVLYLAEAYVPADVSAPTITATGYRDHIGIYQVSIFAPKGETKGNAYTTAELVRTQFPRGLVLTNGVVKVKIEVVSVKPSLTIGDRFVIPVSIRYRSIN